MNYRHLYHAGNFADVMKHALLVRLARALQQKPRGILFLDTHAGRGSYDLALAATGDSLARQPEYPAGIGRLWAKTELAPSLADYIGLVKTFDGQAAATGESEENPRFYPGSPALLRLLAREQDRVALCELQPEEYKHLEQRFSGLRRVSVQAIDGYMALRAMLPPPERRGLVLIDPPYEAPTEWTRVVAALKEGLERFPSGVYAVWYPLTERARASDFFDYLKLLKLPPTLTAELMVDPHSPGLKGCGLLILNPPWQFDREASAVLNALTPLLQCAPETQAEVRWVVPE